LKKSQQVLGLPVLSIEEGKQIGIVKHLILNPEHGTVDYLLVEDDTWYLGIKTIPFEAVQGIGEFGLTIGNRSLLSLVTDHPEVIELLEKNLRLPGIKVLSKKGRLVGTISDFIIDENTAGIVGCQLIPADSEKPAGIIPRKFILTFGRDFLVVEEGIEDMLVAELQETEDVFPPIPATAQDTAKVVKNKEQPVDALKHFEEQQRKYLIGKKVTMKIVADNGEVIAEEGDIITSDMIERARATDRYIQLTLNIRD